MANQHLKRIQHQFEKSYKDHVDVKDAKINERDSKFLTRSLVLSALELLCELPPEKGSFCITDGTGDNGIDGFYFHPEERSIYLMQSKWSLNGTKTIEVGDIHKFIQGAKDILDKNKQAFSRSTKITNLWPKIEYAVDEANRIQLVIIFNSDETLSPDAQKIIDAYKKENNTPTEIVFSRIVSQKDLFNQVTGSASPAINLEAPIFSWGQAKEPHLSVYGQIYCAEVATWYARFGDRLFAPNIRAFLGDTDVNQRIQKTLFDDPELFWYFNNGITATCDKLERKLSGGTEFSNFNFQNLRIVNGAQTVGAIHSAFQDSGVAVRAEQAKVYIKVISLDKANELLGNQITVSTNTQNRVNARDFLALDKLQARIKSELFVSGINYTFKAGEVVADKASGFDLDEAVIAIACSMKDYSYAVLAKRNIGLLVSNEKTGKYNEIFSEKIEGSYLWEKVKQFRLIDAAIATEKNTRQGRDAQILVHGNRLLAHCVFQIIDIDHKVKIPDVVHKAALSMTEIVKKSFKESYMAVLFKNSDKSGAIAKYIIKQGIHSAKNITPDVSVKKERRKVE